MGNEYGAVGGMRFSKETQVLEENLLQCNFVHHNPHIN
jgi:hypothetical protein